MLYKFNKVQRYCGDYYNIMTHSFNMHVNPIRSVVFERINDPYDLENYCINHHNTMSCMRILRGVSHMFQVDFFQNSPFYSDFKINSGENSCKYNFLLYSLNWTSNTQNFTKKRCNF